MNTTIFGIPNGKGRKSLRVQILVSVRALLKLKTILGIGLVATILVGTGRLTMAWADTYDLATVKNINAFAGSAAAKALLAKNGFVMADPSFKQIFEPYIKSVRTGNSSQANPMGTTLPSFITTDYWTGTNRPPSPS